MTLLGCPMLGLSVMLLALYLSAGLMARKKPGKLERHLGMVGFACLTPSMIIGRFPVLILTILLLMFVGFLHKAR